MEAIMFHGSPDQTFYSYKSNIRNSNRTTRPFVSENFLSSSDFNNMMGLLQGPPPFLSHSYPPYSLQQPPLLPLPAPNHRRSAAARGPSCPPINRRSNNGNRTKDPSLTPKKPKSPTKNLKKEETDSDSPKKSSTVSLTRPLGPEPKQLSKDVRRVLPSVSSGNIGSVVESNKDVRTNYRSSSLKSMEDQVEIFSGSVAHTISPPPSSLPLPTFSLRPKLSCNAEAAGIDTGATDNLRRLLRLR